MKRLPISISLVLLLATIGAYADTGIYCPAAPPCRSKYACCPNSGAAGPPGGFIGTPTNSPAGPTSTGDPLILADQATYERILDYAMDTPNGRLAFFRSYSSTYKTFAWGTSVENPGVPKPFGSNPWRNQGYAHKWLDRPELADPRSTWARQASWSACR